MTTEQAKRGSQSSVKKPRLAAPTSHSAAGKLRTILGLRSPRKLQAQPGRPGRTGIQEKHGGDREVNQGAQAKVKTKTKTKVKIKTKTEDAAHRRPQTTQSPHQPRPSSLKVELHDLDHRRSPCTLTVNLGAEARSIKEAIRKLYGARHGRGPKPLRVDLYSDGKELHRHHVLEHPLPIVWYRLAAKSCGDDYWRITYRKKHGDSAVAEPLLADLLRAIEAGNTVAQVRRVVAQHMGIPDRNRVILIAGDGVRPGPLQGELWEVRRIRDWFCRWLSIDVAREHDYVILDGLGRLYIHHREPSATKGEGEMDMRGLRRSMVQRSLAHVDRLGESRLSIGRAQVVLLRDGARPPSSSHVVWGTTYSFALDSEAAEEALARDESWLLAATETCAVCGDARKITELPVRIATGCKHKPNTCRTCMYEWLRSSMETSIWDRLRCPECPELLQFHDVRRLASKEVFGRYDALATRAALENMDDFRWCLSPSCESGQVHDPACARFTCASCKSKHCVKHQVPWHSGETCAEYDQRSNRRREEDEASETTISQTSKKCPRCAKNVHKWTGCNHMTCVCGFEWCYVCLAPFHKNQQGFLYCHHGRGCTEHDDLANIIDPPPHRRLPITDRLQGPRPQGFPPPLTRRRPNGILLGGGADIPLRRRQGT